MSVTALPRGITDWLVPQDAQARSDLQLGVIRVLVVASLVLGANYVVWRMLFSVNWNAWPIAIPLLVAETYSYIGAWLFAVTAWQIRLRPAPPPPPPDLTVDVFITCYNEPVEVVQATTYTAVAIRYPHRTYVLDDGNTPIMRAMAAHEGAGYITRSTEWTGKQRHAKAGNLNNALFQTTGEFMLILDADQIPSPNILDKVLGYFVADPQLAFVQTPQWFYNVPDDDPLGCQAPLFYGPIQRGKDGWNAAFFCGSNAVLRREAVLQSGVFFYVRDLERRIVAALSTARKVLDRALTELPPDADPALGEALRQLQATAENAQRALRSGQPIQDLTWRFQQEVRTITQSLVDRDMAALRAELALVPGLDAGDLEGSLGELLDEGGTDVLTAQSLSPLTAVAVVGTLVEAVDLDRSDEAQPVMPMSTISVTEDMATAMRMHSLGWRSVYHDEILAIGMAPEDLGSSLQQRLRWAQGTLQVMFRENPLFLPGLSLAQRVMYFATMWSYLYGFFAVVYLISPPLYLFFGVLPVAAYSEEFFWRLVPYLIANQLLLTVVGLGVATWRGQQYSLALFPLWIQAATSTVGNVFFGKKLGFVVTPKTRQAAAYLGLFRMVWPQLVMILALMGGACYGLTQIILGNDSHPVSTLVNVAWSFYDVVMLSVIFDALAYDLSRSAADQTAGA